MKILTINPGSTSTKLALFAEQSVLFSKIIRHDPSALRALGDINAQAPLRRQAVMDAMAEHGHALDSVDCFAARGPAAQKVVGGVYAINDKMLADAKAGLGAKHPCNLGCQIARELADQTGKACFIANPPVTDEFSTLARITGLHDVERESFVHALNQKEMGIRYARTLGKGYEECNLVIAHIGGGVSVTAHEKGRMVDSNDIVNGDGPMAPNRSGALPAAAVVKLCYSGKYTQQEMLERITRNGGLLDHLGTDDGLSIVKRIQEGDKQAAVIFDAMIYQIGKWIGAMSVVPEGPLDGIILTGGFAHNKYLTDTLTQRVSFLAPVALMPGEFEMEALAAGALRVLKGEEQAKEYTGEPVWDGALF